MTAPDHLQEYLEVSDRIGLFYGKHPQGSLQGEGEFVRDEQGRIFGYVYTARAFRSPEDTCPGVGTAFEPIPGATPYTRNSEVMNAETSAWGRAIVACGFPSKNIASANEVRARQDSGGQEAESTSRGGAAPQPPPPENPAEKAMAAQAAHRSEPQDDGKPENVVLEFGKHKGLPLGQLPQGYLEWLDQKFEARNPHQRRAQEAARMLLGTATAPLSASDDGIPF